MRLVAFINGWKEAPHCWPRYVFHPLRIERAGAWTCVEILGWAWFFAKGEDDGES